MAGSCFALKHLVFAFKGTDRLQMSTIHIFICMLVCCALCCKVQSYRPAHIYSAFLFSSANSTVYSTDGCMTYFALTIQNFVGISSTILFYVVHFFTLLVMALAKSFYQIMKET